MVQPAQREATYQDVLDAPPHMTAELIGRQLYLHPRPAKPHMFSASTLGARLIVSFGSKKAQPGGWWILHEPEVHLGSDVVVPDIAGLGKTDVPELSLETAYFQTVPTWVCEVLSPGTERHDRIEKLRLYGQAGVSFAWLVHPVQHTLEVYVHQGGHWVQQGAYVDNASVQAVPFDAVTLDLDELWL